MEFKYPGGDITTVLDLASRDIQDDHIFPLKSNISWFTRRDTRTHPYTPTIQSFSYKGRAGFGQTITFEIPPSAGDLLHFLALQIRPEHWFPSSIIEAFNTGTNKYDKSYKAYTWTNSLGTILIERAEFKVGDTVLETVNSTWADISFKLFGSVNSQVGISVDSIGAVQFGDPTNRFNPNNMYPIENGTWLCPLPFWFNRNRMDAAFPIASCRENTIRITLTFRPFHEVIRCVGGSRQSCTETPLGKSWLLTNGTTVNAKQNIGDFQDLQIITYTSFIDEQLRQQRYIQRPFEFLFRQCQTFHISEPMKYAVSGNSTTDKVNIIVPLECNGPIEEIIWVIRRKGVAINNDWTNYAPAVESQIIPSITRNSTADREFPELLDRAIVQVNGLPVIDMNGNWFRRHIAEKHSGGFVSYKSYIYGYSFADKPGTYQPSGSANMSRGQDLRLNLSIYNPFPVSLGPGFSDDLSNGWEVFVHCVGINWVRFEYGICNPVFSS